MTDAGRAVLPDMTDKGFVIDDDVMKELKSDPVVWHNFCRLPELYKRVRIDTPSPMMAILFVTVRLISLVV